MPCTLLHCNTRCNTPRQHPLQHPLSETASRCLAPPPAALNAKGKAGSFTSDTVATIGTEVYEVQAGKELPFKQLWVR